MRVAAALLLAIPALVLASAAAARDPKAPQQRHTAADTRLATSIALRRGDLAAGWKPQPKQKPPPPCVAEPDESKLVQTAQVDPTFVWKDGITNIGSEVDIFKTAAQARLDWRLTTLKVVRVCLLQTARDAARRQHATVRLLPVAVLPAPKGGERAFHYRLAFEFRRANKVAVWVEELVGLGVGPVSVVLHAFSPVSPLPKSAVDTLTALLAQRLGAVSGGV